MARITEDAARVIKEIAGPDLAIRFGLKKNKEHTSFFFDFVPKSAADPFNEIAYISNGVMLLVRRDEEDAFGSIVMDYVIEPEGFTIADESPKGCHS